ncbi:MAG: glycosyltransferase family 4 protein [Chloroflexota bacterium]|nr:MAG: glycosyltransferase family 4 protein [Chloroflexota bacterium]
MRVAIVHDYLNQYGGAERVLEELGGMFPDAPVFTSMYWPERMSARIRAMDIRVSFMQRLPGVVRRHQWYLPLYTQAVERHDLSEFDLVISNSSAFARGAICRPDAVHVCYCLTPMRWAWNYDAYVAREELGSVSRAILPAFIDRLRDWEIGAVDRVDRYVAISTEVARRIRDWYGRESDVVYPPVSVERFRPAAPEDVGDYALVVSRLVPYKRIDLAIDACHRLGLPLKIAGSGRDEDALRRRAGPTVDFLGRVPDADLNDLMARSRVFLFPGEEDFGITPLESNAAGRPVVAYAAGGALDTVRDGISGRYFHEQTVDSLADALADAYEIPWSSAAIRRHAEAFAPAVFRERLSSAIGAAIVTKRNERAGARVSDRDITLFLANEVWPRIPADVLGKPVPRAEWEAILGYIPDGV